ncbi:hypothetical protein J6590_101817 [Homalodisca vitripennis]|nr:hypothetical protein J6590_101817 [Homalodisca vitripennis]
MPHLWLHKRRQLQVAGVVPSQPKVFPGAGGMAGDVCHIDTTIDGLYHHYPYRRHNRSKAPPPPSPFYRRWS